jgi:CheY-like chemotaxis protein
MKLNRTVAKWHVTHNIIQAKNGEEALDILQGSDKLPDIILLDLNMPRMNGIEFLQILKQDPELKYLPTVILTTSQNRADLLECYRIGIAGYIIKPLKYEDYEDKLQKVISYWEVNELVKA